MFKVPEHPLPRLARPPLSRNIEDGHLHVSTYARLFVA
jgi:hypothetical protein